MEKNTKTAVKLIIETLVLSDTPQRVKSVLHDTVQIGPVKPHNLGNFKVDKSSFIYQKIRKGA
jgi:hypothetical protein